MAKEFSHGVAALALADFDRGLDHSSVVVRGILDRRTGHHLDGSGRVCSGSGWKLCPGWLRLRSPSPKSASTSTRGATESVGFDQQAMVHVAMAAVCLPALVLIISHCRFATRKQSELQAEKAIVEAVNRRRILMEESSDGIVVLDMDGGVYEANHRFAEMLGYSDEEVKLLHVWEWDARWDREQLRAMIRCVSKNGDHFETRHRRKDGAQFDVEISNNAAVFGDQKFVFCICRDISRRKQVEQALREREAQYRAVIEATSDGFYVLDHKGRFLEVNDAYFRYSGYTLEELRGIHVADLEAIETPEEVDRHGKLIRQNGSDSFETVQRARDGSLRPVEINISYWADGRRYFVFVRDITQRKMVQSALRKWADAFENCAHGIALGDPATGRILASNSAFARLQDRSVEEVVGTEFLAYYANSDRDFVRARNAESDQLGQTRYEARIIRKDGSLLPIQVDLVSVRDEGGQILYRVATVQDISERKRAKQALDDSAASTAVAD